MDVHEEDAKRALNKAPIRPEGKALLLALTKRLRVHLESKDLPTDKSPIMPIERDFGYVPEEHGIVSDEDLWFCVAEGSTQPLTEHRLAAELLHTSNRLLARFDEDELRDVFRAMSLYHLYYSVGELHSLALAGLARGKGLARGPQEKKERSRALQQETLNIAQEYWRRHPEFRDRPFNTAKKIADTVNKERERLDPKSKPLAYSTISKLIRRAQKDVGHQ
jgi:hypothetical protein